MWPIVGTWPCCQHCRRDQIGPQISRRRRHWQITSNIRRSGQRSVRPGISAVLRTKARHSHHSRSCHQGRTAVRSGSIKLSPVMSVLLLKPWSLHDLWLQLTNPLSHPRFSGMSRYVCSGFNGWARLDFVCFKSNWPSTGTYSTSHLAVGMWLLFRV
jgi:hypothetical protein